MGSSLKCGHRQLISKLRQLAAGMFFIFYLIIATCSYTHNWRSFDFLSSIRYPKGLLPSTRRGQKSVLRPGRPLGDSATNYGASPNGILSMRCPVRWGLDSALKSLPGNFHNFNFHVTTFCAGEGPPEGNEGGLQGGPSQDPAQDHWLHRLQGSCSGQVRS